MTGPNRLIVGAVLLTLLAAAVGGWIGVRYAIRGARPAPGLDELVHRGLDLTATQRQQITALESDFAEHRKVLDDEMRAANRELAIAIESNHAYGPAAQEAVERFHKAAAALQEQTIKHVLAMRAVLTPDQARRFDVTVSEALTSSGP
jgi:nickel and cobalt resistance protein CnrR